MKSIAHTLSHARSTFASLVTRTIDYEADGTPLEGYHAYEDSIEGPRPGVLIVHQWTGLTDYEKGRARQLAEMGYNVFALDIYGKGIRPHPPAAGKEAGKYKGNRELFRQRLDAGLHWLREDKRTDPERVAAIGYCFGGTGVLELARSGATLSGVVSFHGGLGAAEGLLAK
ncbi:MAG: dienelactone hydrolase family protein [Verrucomicrobiales bacterium]